MQTIIIVVLIWIVGISTSCRAQQLPPPAPSFRSDKIPGGVLHWAGKGVAGDPAEDISLSVGNHTLRAYWLTPLGNVAQTVAPPTLYADGKPLIVAESELPMMGAVLTGGGHTYVRVTEGVDEDHPPNLWIVDVSATKVIVTRRIVGCNPLKQEVTDGAYVLVCNVNGKKRNVTHVYKDGVFR